MMIRIPIASPEMPATFTIQHNWIHDDWIRLGVPPSLPMFFTSETQFFGGMNPDVGHFWAILLGKTTGSGGGGFDSAGAPMAYIPSISIVYIYVYIHTYIYLYI